MYVKKNLILYFEDLEWQPVTRFCLTPALSLGFIIWPVSLIQACDWLIHGLAGPWLILGLLVERQRKLYIHD